MADVAKFKMDLAWKEFNVSLDAVHAFMQAHAGDQYCGLQASHKLEVWFKEQPAQDAQDAVQAYWDGLTSDGAEATQYVSSSAIQAKMAELRAGLISKSWDAMSVAEKKLLAGMTPSLSELGLV